MSDENITGQSESADHELREEVNYQFLTALRTQARTDGTGIVVVVEVVNPVWPNGVYPLATLARSSHPIPSDAARDALCNGTLMTDVSADGGCVHLSVTTIAADGQQYFVQTKTFDRSELDRIEARFVEHARIAERGIDLEPVGQAAGS